MVIGLAAYEFRNKDIRFNLGQIRRGLREAAGKADLLCFGEAFLQGFDSLSWDYETDRHMAVSQDSRTMDELRHMTDLYGVDLLFGYIEAEGESLYSSCALIESGRLTHNYRRISRGWKEYWHTDGHYREGDSVTEFTYRGQKMLIALCGDLWDYPERFKTDGVLLWPVFVNFSLDEWAHYEPEYAAHAALASRRTLMIDPLSLDQDCAGAAFYFKDGTTAQKSPFNTECILIVDI